MFLVSVCVANGAVAGLESAGNESMPKRMLKVIALGENGRDPTSFSYTVQLFGIFAYSFLPGATELTARVVEVVSIWHKAGVFPALVRSLLNSENSSEVESILYSVFSVARLATSVCCSSSIYFSPENRLGNAPLWDLSDPGIRRLLDRPDVERRRKFTGMVTMLKIEFTSLDLFNRPRPCLRVSKDGRIDVTDEDRQCLLSAAEEAVTSVFGLGGALHHLANRTRAARGGPDQAGDAEELRLGNECRIGNRTKPSDSGGSSSDYATNMLSR